MVKSQLFGKAKRGLAALILSAGIVTGLENCVTSEMSYTRFLTCNEWVDKNNNGAVDTSEYIGVKDQFRANERMTLVAEVNGPLVKGAVLKTRLVNGLGKELDLSPEETILPFESNSMKYAFDPWEIYNLGGQGKYTAYFILNNNLIGIKNFVIIR